MPPTAGTAASWGPPTPCDDPAGYTIARVQQGLDYAEALMSGGLVSTVGSTTRKITPITTKILGLYSVACEETLVKLKAKEEGKTVQDDDLNGAKREVHEHEMLMKYNEFLRNIVTSEKRKILVIQPMLALRKYQLLCRYGDYVRFLVAELRQKAYDLGIADYHHISATFRWSVISNAVNDDMKLVGPLAARLATEDIPSEKEAFYLLTDEQLKGAPTLRAIYNTAGAIGLSWRVLVRAVQTYAERNETVHSQLDEYLEKGNDDDIAQLLYRDLSDLPKIFEPEDADDEAMYSMIITRLITEWFETHDDIHDLKQFERKPALGQLISKAKRAAGISDPAKKAQAATERQEHEEALKKKLAKAVAARHADGHLIEHLVNPPDDGRLPDPEVIGAIPSDTGKHARAAMKRQASATELPEEQVRKLRVKRSKEFDTLLDAWHDASHRLHKSAETSIAEARQLRTRQMSYYRKWDDRSTERPQMPEGKEAEEAESTIEPPPRRSSLAAADARSLTLPTHSKKPIAPPRRSSRAAATHSRTLSDPPMASGSGTNPRSRRQSHGTPGHARTRSGISKVEEEEEYEGHGKGKGRA